jgi:hypothetical protein
MAAWYDGIVSGLSNLNANDVGSIMQGTGVLAGAWGSYESDKKRNQMLQDQMNYEKQKDQTAQSKLDKAQTSLDNAFDSSLLNPLNKKKKNADGTYSDGVVSDITATAI